MTGMSTVFSRLRGIRELFTQVKKSLDNKKYWFILEFVSVGRKSFFGFGWETDTID